jgi:hypothetical protein
MAIFWCRFDSEGEHRWEPTLLVEHSTALSGNPEQPVVAAENDAPALVMRSDGESDRILLSNGSAIVRVNGEALLLGIRVLRDRDAIRIGASEPIFFSTESLPRITRYIEDRIVPCARCRTEIALDEPAVKCPRCAAWHHQHDEMPCWTHADTCAACQQPTPLDGGYQWSPEGL